MNETRAALIDGTLNFIIAHPLARLATTAVNAMAEAALSSDLKRSLPNTILPFDIYTPENI